MSKILYKNEIVEYLNLPNIPKKPWDGKRPFKSAVGVLQTKWGGLTYAVLGFSEKANAAYVKKVFGEEPFIAINEIYPVPDYMDIEDIENWDLDEDSKKAAKSLAQEALEKEEIEEKEEKYSEWYFDEIHNIDEARAWVANYRRMNKIKGNSPKTEEKLKDYLYVVYKNQKRGLK